MAAASCGCSACTGIEPVTPQSVANAPGQSALHYRVGTHAAFSSTMRARLSAFPGLSGLTARDLSDASLAVLDGWACIADVLSFYQERIANEGYLRTATERYSLGEIGRLVGYKPRPGVAASAFLAFQMETGYQGVIPPGTRAQSLPGQDQLPQPFETAEPIEARDEWNNLAPRRYRPQRVDEDNAFYIGTVYFDGVALSLKAGDPLLLVWGNGDKQQVLRTVATVTRDTERGTTQATLVTRLTEASFFAALQDIVRRVLPERMDEASAAPVSAAWRQDLEQLGQLMAELQPSGDERRDAVVKYLRFLDELDTRRKTETLPQTPPGRDELLDELIRLFQSLAPRFRADLEVDSFFGAAAEERRDSVLRPSPETPGAPSAIVPGRPNRFQGVAAVLRQVSITPSHTTVTAFSVPQSSFVGTPGRETELGARLLARLTGGDTGAFLPTFAQRGASAAKTRPVAQPRPAQVYALRVTAGLFGHNAQPRLRVGENGELTPVEDDRDLEGDDRGAVGQETLFFERDFPDLLPGEWAVVQTDPLLPREEEGDNVRARRKASAAGDGLRPESGEGGDDGLRYARIRRIESGISRSAYGISGKTTVLTLAPPDAPGVTWWWRRPRNAQPRPIPDGLSNDERAIAERERAAEANKARFADLRRTVVYTKPEPLVLALEPLSAAVYGSTIALNGAYEGLTPGRRIIVTGERTDLFGAQNIPGAEIAMIAGVEQKPDPYRANDQPQTTITLVRPLAYSYKRATALVHGNVARATHGETRSEILGSGDAAAVLQRFTLRQKPLTYVSSPTPSGIESTLHVYVDDVRWHESPHLNQAAFDTRTFATSGEETGETTLYFGDGERGARLPTGQDNIRAVYRTGIGRAGNVGAAAISQLVSRPLGVKSVVNPVAASGGAEAEAAETMREHIPLSLASLERLISPGDYAAFTRVFAGVGKASAVRLTDGRRNVLQVTIAGVEDGVLDSSGDLFRNLKTALRQYGDPTVALSLRVREKIVPIVGAKIKVLPDFLWEKVAPAVQTALWNAFAFNRRALGQPLFPSEVLTVIQAVPGVDYVDLDTFAGLSESDAADPEKLEAFFDTLGSPEPGEPVASPPQPLVVLPGRLDKGTMVPAQLAYLDAALPETLILNEIP